MCRQRRQRVQLPGVEERIVPGPVDSHAENPNEPGRFTIALDDLAKLLTASGLLRIRNNNVVGDAVASGKPFAEKQTLIDVVNTVCNRSDFTVNTVPLLGEQSNIGISMSMFKEVFKSSFRELFVISGISEESSFIDQKQTIG